MCKGLSRLMQQVRTITSVMCDTFLVSSEFYPAKAMSEEGGRFAAAAQEWRSNKEEAKAAGNEMPASLGPPTATIAMAFLETHQ